ncbi:hypothetical protein B0H14DRAFT_2572903 [Mycena olivaceomarginata]|nr:hypothetical protein B0H14DRAFT_2572903 [Mycena olivaceomarginata]
MPALQPTRNLHGTRYPPPACSAVPGENRAARTGYIPVADHATHPPGATELPAPKDPAHSQDPVSLSLPAPPPFADLRWYHPYLAVALIYVLLISIAVYAVLRAFIKPLTGLIVLYYMYRLLDFMASV